MTQGTANVATMIAVEPLSASSRPSASGLVPAHASPAKRFVSPEDFRLLTGWSESTVRRRIRDGSLPVIQPGGPRTLVLIDLAALSGAAHAAMTGTNPTSATTPTAEPSVDGNPIVPQPRPRGPRPRWTQIS